MLDLLEILLFWLGYAQPFVVVFNGMLGLIISFMTLRLYIQTRPKKIRTKAVAPTSVVINWSGHPLPKEKWLEKIKIWTPSMPPKFNVKSWDTIQESARKLFHDLPKDLQVRLFQGDPTVIIVIPQLAVGVGVLLAYLHGKMGGFPTITSPLRKEDNTFWLPEPISLGEIRLKSRENRDMN